MADLEEMKVSRQGVTVVVRLGETVAILSASDARELAEALNALAAKIELAERQRSEGNSHG